MCSIRLLFCLTGGMDDGYSSNYMLQWGIEIVLGICSKSGKEHDKLKQVLHSI